MTPVKPIVFGVTCRFAQDVNGDIRALVSDVSCHPTEPDGAHVRTSPVILDTVRFDGASLIFETHNSEYVI